MTIPDLQALSAQCLWHPCSQMQDYERFKPLAIKSAAGSYLELADGRKMIDAISSWWCKSLGHNHPDLKQALLDQLERFEHVILANTTHEGIIQLSQRLAALMPHLSKVFYASEGSSAVEIALKMSLHTRVIEGNSRRQHFLALKNGYHGETLGALSVSDIGLYRQPYTAALFNTPFIEAPYVSGVNDPLWNDAQALWLETEKGLMPYAEITTALIFEPIVQGAAGMKIISKDFLERLAHWAQQHHIHLIADEIMTGIGRTGKMLACEHTNIKPDFICLSKGLTSGWLPLSAVITTEAIYQCFYDDYASDKAFLHSHTYSGNALAVSVANATLTIIEQQELCERAANLQNRMRKQWEDIATQTQRLENIRGIGAIVAADLITDTPNRRQGYAVFQEAVQRGALLRPIGNTLYWLPPLIIEEHTLDELQHITMAAINAAYA